MQGILVQKEDIDSPLLKSASSTITLKTTQRQSQKNSEVEREKQSGVNPELPEPHPTDKVKVRSFLPKNTRSACSKAGVSVQSPDNTKNPEDGVSFPLGLLTSLRGRHQHKDAPTEWKSSPSHPRGNMGLMDPLQQVPRTINSLPAQRQDSSTTCSWAASKQQI